MGSWGAEAYDASFHDGVLEFDYASDKDYGKTKTSGRTDVDITVKNGMIDGRPVNLDLDSSSIKEVRGKIKDGTRTAKALENHGFKYNSYKDAYVKGYGGYEVHGDTLYADFALPSDLSGVKKAKTKYGSVDTRPLKNAGFKWNPTQKQWQR